MASHRASAETRYTVTGLTEARRALKHFEGEQKTWGHRMNAAGKIAFASLTFDRRKIRQGFRDLRKSSGDLGNTLLSLGRTAGVAGGAIVAAMAGAAYALKKFIDSYAEYAGAVLKVNRLTGIGVKQASLLSVQWRLSGVESEKAATGMRFLAKNLYDAQTKAGTARDNFKAMGVSVFDANGHLRTATDLLPELRDHMSNLDNSAKRTALSVKLFGRGGSELLPWLMKDSAAIADMNVRARKLGLVMDKQGMETFKRYRKAQRDMSLAWFAFKLAAGKALMPLVTKWLVALSNWFTDHMPVINTAFKKFSDIAAKVADWAQKNLTKALKGLGDWIKRNGPGIVRFLEKVVAAMVWIAGNRPNPTGQVGGANLPGRGPGTAQSSASASGNVNLGKRMAAAQGWTGAQWDALYKLWMGESGWRANATNASSGAYGIPQALPASKMASAGADWRSNPATQIRWGLSYIKSRYGTPGNAYAQWQSRNPHWYDAGGWLPPGVSLAVNQTGRPERVLAPSGTRHRDLGAGGDGLTVIVEGDCYGYEDLYRAVESGRASLVRRAAAVSAS